MRFFENMSTKEIGERLGLTVSTVENHMYLALKNLRDKLLWLPVGRKPDRVFFCKIFSHSD